MKTALITTTVYVPRVLERYRQLDRDAVFFVAGDRATPHTEARQFVEKLGNAAYYSDSDQEKLGYSCSAIIGWNKIMRRNIALLEAMKWGADVIISIDDDNIPLAGTYFDDFRTALSCPYYGMMVTPATGWFNVGDFFVPKIYHRGFPYQYRARESQLRLSPVCGAKVGVAAGLWLGDPDIDAVERIANNPVVHQFSEVVRTGIIVDRSCFTPFNSQNTGFVAELAPLLMVWTGVGRYDDIWASYVAQRVMRESDYHVHFGKPYVYQQRHPQNIWGNLKDEIYGMEHTTQFCEDLLKARLDNGHIVSNLRRLYDHLSRLAYLPNVVHELGKAWLSDIEKIF